MLGDWNIINNIFCKDPFGTEPYSYMSLEAINTDGRYLRIFWPTQNKVIPID